MTDILRYNNCSDDMLLLMLLISSITFVCLHLAYKYESI